MPESYATVLNELRHDASTTAQPENEEWEAMISRIKTTGPIHEITEETYWYFLEVLPPRWMAHDHFAFAEGEEPLQLFWDKGNEYRTRCLTWEETTRVLDARRHSYRKHA